MALSNYTELKASVADWLNRSDLTDQIVDFIRLAEAELNRRPEVVEQKFTTITLDGDPEALPSDCDEVESLFWNESEAHGAIELVSPELLARRQAEYNATGRPRFAAITDNGTKLRLAPVPEQAYTAIIQYRTFLTPLVSASQGVNWFLQKHPDVYLFGALAQSEPFLKNDERVATWERKYEKALGQIALKNERRKYANTPIVRPRRGFGV